MKVAAIIVTYNGKDYIRGCIDSLLQSTFKTHIFIVDNASTDGTVKLIGEYPGIRLIRLKKNYGFGYANNIGIHSALMHDSYDFIFLLNQDTVVDRECISTLLDTMQSNMEYGILSPMHFAPTGELDFNFQKYISTNNEFLLDCEKPQMKEIYFVPFVNAAAWMISSKCIELVGGFDITMFHHYGEDENFCQRVIYFGLLIGFIPGAKITHFRSNQNRCPDLIGKYESVLRRQKIRMLDINLSKHEFHRLYIKYIINIFLVFFKSLFLMNFAKIRFLYQKFKTGNLFIRTKIVRSRALSKRGGLVFLDNLPDYN